MHRQKCPVSAKNKHSSVGLFLRRYCHIFCHFQEKLKLILRNLILCIRLILSNSSIWWKRGAPKEAPTSSYLAYSSYRAWALRSPELELGFVPDFPCLLPPVLRLLSSSWPWFQQNWWSFGFVLLTEKSRFEVIVFLNAAGWVQSAPRGAGLHRVSSKAGNLVLFIPSNPISQVTGAVLGCSRCM